MRQGKQISRNVGIGDLASTLWAAQLTTQLADNFRRSETKRKGVKKMKGRNPDDARLISIEQTDAGTLALFSINGKFNTWLRDVDGWRSVDAPELTEYEERAIVEAVNATETIYFPAGAFSQPNPSSLRERLIAAATAYDRAESKKRSYNRNALGIYFNQIDNVINDVNRGASPRAALTAAFSGRLLNALLKALGEGRASDAEQRGGLYYVPASDSNPSFTVALEIPSVRESVDVKALTVGSALRRGKRKLRGEAGRAKPRWTVERNPYNHLTTFGELPLRWPFTLVFDSTKEFTKVSEGDAARFHPSTGVIDYAEVISIEPETTVVAYVPEEYTEAQMSGDVEINPSRGKRRGLPLAFMANPYPSGVTMPEELTDIQREALQLMDETNTGAIFVSPFGWIFPTHVRNDNNGFGYENAQTVSAAIVRKLTEGEAVIKPAVIYGEENPSRTSHGLRLFEVEFKSRYLPPQRFTVHAFDRQDALQRADEEKRRRDLGAGQISIKEQHGKRQNGRASDRVFDKARDAFAAGEYKRAGKLSARARKLRAEGNPHYRYSALTRLEGMRGSLMRLALVDEHEISGLPTLLFVSNDEQRNAVYAGVNINDIVKFVYVPELSNANELETYEIENYLLTHPALNGLMAIPPEQNGGAAFPAQVRGKLDKLNLMFHGDSNPHRGKTSRVYVSDRARQKYFTRNGSLPALKPLNWITRETCRNPKHVCENCSIMFNPRTSFVGMTQNKRLQLLGEGVHSVGKRVRGQYEKQNPEWAGRVIDLGPVFVLWYETPQKHSEAENPPLISYYHNHGEETGRVEDMPRLKLDERGMFYFDGGNYTITEAGVEN